MSMQPIFRAVFIAGLVGLLSSTLAAQSNTAVNDAVVSDAVVSDAAANDTEANRAVTFGVLPFVPPGVLEYRFRGLTNGLSEALQRPVIIQTRDSYDAFSQALLQQRFDIALIQPWDYFSIRESKNYVALVQKNSNLRGAYITLDNNLADVSQLRGKVIAFPDKRAAVTRLAMLSLQEQGLIEGDYIARYHKDHQSCLLAVASHSAEVCVAGDGYGRTSIERAGRNFRIFAFTEPMPPILIVVKPDFLAQQESLAEWFVALSESKIGKNILKEAFLDDLVFARDSDYVEWFEFHDESCCNN